MFEPKKIVPKRFTDRKDCFDIVQSVKHFSYRSHNAAPNWLYYFFYMMVAWYFVVLLYVSINVLQTSGADVNTIYIIQYLLVNFLLFSGFIVFMIRKLKNTLNASEFIGLSVSKSLENYTNSYCLINKQGKIFYYNYDFVKQFMSSNEVETKKYEDLLNKDIFDKTSLDKIKDTIENGTSHSLNLAANNNVSANVYPLSRPEGVFSLNIVSKK